MDMQDRKGMHTNAFHFLLAYNQVKQGLSIYRYEMIYNDNKNKFCSKTEK